MTIDEAYARFARDWEQFIDGWTKRIVSRRGSSADLDDVRQAARIAAWEGYREWQALPEGERDPELLRIMIPRRIKNAVIKEWSHVRGARAAGVTATLLRDYVEGVLSRTKEPGYVEGRLQSMSHTLTALHFLVFGLSQGSASGVTAESAVLLEEARHRLVFAIARLSEDQRTLIDGYYFHGRRLREIGAELGKSPQALTRLHHAALELLREEMEEFASLIKGRHGDPTLGDDPFGGTSAA